MIAYRSALHGLACTEGHDVQIIASGDPGLFKAVGFACRFVRLPRRFAERGELSTDGVTAVDRLGLEVDVTTVE